MNITFQSGDNTSILSSESDNKSMNKAQADKFRKIKIKQNQRLEISTCTYAKGCGAANGSRSRMVNIFELLTLQILMTS